MVRESEPVFELTGGDIALDLANTVMARATSAPEELLHSYEDFVAWSRQTKLIDSAEAKKLLREAAAHPVTAVRALERTIAVRELLFRVFTANVPTETDLRELASLSTEASQHRRLRSAKGRVFWAWERGGLDGMLWPVIDSAASLLTSETKIRVHTCEGETCRWLFVDNSRQGNRRWCDMKTCGNRAKARRHYERSKGRSS